MIFGLYILGEYMGPSAKYHNQWWSSSTDRDEERGSSLDQNRLCIFELYFYELLMKFNCILRSDKRGSIGTKLNISGFSISRSA